MKKKINNVTIVCASKKQMLDVLKLLDETDIRWASGDKPSTYCYWTHGYDKLYISNGKLSSGHYTKTDTRLITGDHFITAYKNDASSPIIIYFNDNGKTIALDAETGESAEARCDPADKYDRTIGARIALGRLFGDDVTGLYEMAKPANKQKFKVGDKVTIKDGLKIGGNYGGIAYTSSLDKLEKGIPITILKCDPSDNTYYAVGKCCLWYSEEMLEPYVEEKNDTPKFNVGDVVRVRQWEDMKEEFGIDASGDIMCKIRFVDGMRKLCGKKAVITDIDGNWIDLDFIDDVASWCWAFSIDMVEKVNDDEEPVKEPDIKEGDRIVVINNGNLYTTYGEWVNKQDLQEYQKYKYDYGHSVANGTFGEVIRIAKHGYFSDENKLLVYFKEERTGRCYLIGIEGVKKVEE